MHKGQRMSEETKRKISKANKGHRGVDPEKLRQRSKALWSNPEYRQKQSDKHKALWQDEEYRKNQIIKHKAKWQDPEYRVKMDTIHTSQEYIETMRAIGKARPKMSDSLVWREANRKAKQSSGNRKRQSEMATEWMRDPQRRAQISESVSRKWDDPIYREKVTTHPNRCRYGKVTAIELKVKHFLESIGVDFEQEKHIIGLRGWVDFYLPQSNMVIECDGDYWHNRPGSRQKDERRDQHLKSLGIKVLRLSEHEINKKWNDVTRRIVEAMA